MAKQKSIKSTVFNHRMKLFDYFWQDSFKGKLPVILSDESKERSFERNSKVVFSRFLLWLDDKGLKL